MLYNLIQSQLFHLISMLLCIVAVASILVKHFFKSDAKGDDKIRLLNTLYISGILTFIIIELLTAICMNNSSHAEILSFVSFAATLSSLILSIVAIIFTIVSGKNGEAQYQKLDKVSEEVKQSLNKFSEKTSTIDESIDRFQSIAQNLSDQVHEVYDKLTGLETPINQMKDQLLPHSLIDVKETKKKEIEKGSFSEKVSDFIRGGSLSGNFALLACVLSKDKGRPFMLKEIVENESDEAYKLGYIIASSAMGVIDAKVLDSGKTIVSGYYEGLKEMVESAISAYISGAEDEELRKRFLDRYNSILHLFK